VTPPLTAHGAIPLDAVKHYPRSHTLNSLEGSSRVGSGHASALSASQHQPPLYPLGGSAHGHGNLAPKLNMKALVAELEASLSDPWTGEWIGLKLCTLLVRFVEEEMVPVATRAAEMGIDPTPIMEMVAGVLRAFADNLGPPSPRTTRACLEVGHPLVHAARWWLRGGGRS
jgi:hypothetical protein